MKPLTICTIIIFFIFLLLSGFSSADQRLHGRLSRMHSRINSTRHFKGDVPAREKRTVNLTEGLSDFELKLEQAAINFALLEEAKAQKDAGDRELSNEQKAKEKLFKSYDKHVRPVYHHLNTTMVYMEFVPRYIIEVDEEKSLFSMDGWLLLLWQDARLVWNVSDFDGLEILHLPDDYVWQPDIMLYNGHSSRYDPKKDTHLLVIYNGDVYMVPPVELQTYCDTKPQNTYPNDIVTCNLIFGSWSHDGNQVNLSLLYDDIYFQDFKNVNPRWEVLLDESKITRFVKYYNCCAEPYVSVQASIVMKRRFPPELQIIWAPSILVMILTLNMFWLPPGSGKKIMLGSILLLILSVLMVYVGSVTKSPQAPKLAVSFIESTMYIVGSAIVLEILVINLCSFAGPFRAPFILVNFLSGPIGPFIGVFAPWNEKVSGDRIQLKEDIEQVAHHPSIKDEWILVATGIDRVLFLIYIIVLAAVHKA